MTRDLVDVVLFWVTFVGTALVLGFVLDFVRKRYFRMVGMGMAFVFPPLFILGIGLSKGCTLGRACEGYEEGYELGLIFSLALVPVWIIFVIVGAWLKRRFKFNI